MLAHDMLRWFSVGGSPADLQPSTEERDTELFVFATAPGGVRNTLADASIKEEPASRSMEIASSANAQFTARRICIGTTAAGVAAEVEEVAEENVLVPTKINLCGGSPGDAPVVTYAAAGLANEKNVPAPCTSRAALASSIQQAYRSDTREERTWGIVFIPHGKRTTLLKTRVNERTSKREFLVRWAGQHGRWLKKKPTWETREEGLHEHSLTEYPGYYDNVWDELPEAERVSFGGSQTQRDAPEIQGHTIVFYCNERGELYFIDGHKRQGERVFSELEFNKRYPAKERWATDHVNYLVAHRAAPAPAVGAGANGDEDENEDDDDSDDAGIAENDLVDLRQFLRLPARATLETIQKTACDIKANWWCDVQPIHRALRDDADVKLIRQLLVAGGQEQLSAKTRVNGYWPIHVAAQYSTKVEVISLLLKRRGEEQLRARGFRGWLPIHVAARYSTSAEVIRLLTGEGQQLLRAEDAHGVTPLAAAEAARGPQGIPETIKAVLFPPSATRWTRRRTNRPATAAVEEWPAPLLLGNALLEVSAAEAPAAAAEAAAQPFNMALVVQETSEHGGYTSYCGDSAAHAQQAQRLSGRSAIGKKPKRWVHQVICDGAQPQPPELSGEGIHNMASEAVARPAVAQKNMECRGMQKLLASRRTARFSSSAEEDAPVPPPLPPVPAAKRPAVTGLHGHINSIPIDALCTAGVSSTMSGPILRVRAERPFNRGAFLSEPASPTQLYSSTVVTQTACSNSEEFCD
jgi:hypothetical protein